MISIIPSILTNSSSEFDEMMSSLEGNLERVHFDVIDGIFVDNHTIEPSIMIDYDSNLLIDYHLMVDEPIMWVDKCVEGQADRIIGHIERMSDQISFVGKVQSVGSKVGLAIDLYTPVERLDSVILNNLDVVLVMGVKAGFGGQDFNDEVLTKITKLDQIRSRDKTPFRICVDGGVRPENIRRIKIAGADEVNVGRSLFKDSIIDNITMYTRATYG